MFTNQEFKSVWEKKRLLLIELLKLTNSSFPNIKIVLFCTLSSVYNLKQDERWLAKFWTVNQFTLIFWVEQYLHKIMAGHFFAHWIFKRFELYSIVKLMTPNLSNWGTFLNLLKYWFFFPCLPQLILFASTRNSDTRLDIIPVLLLSGLGI